jgi:putative Holliday junction resolvase
LQIIANSVATIDTPKIFDFIKDYMAREQVERFIVGYPYNDGFKENPVVPFIEKFIVTLQKQYPQVPVEKVDESFTSKMAMQTLVMSGVSKKERHKKENLDKISATIILQSYMDGKA